MVYYKDMERDKLLKQYIKQRKINSNATRFIDYVSDVTKGEYTVIGDYKGAKNKVKIKHNKCGFVYEITPIYFKRGKRCPNCTGSSHKRNQQEFVWLLNKKRPSYQLVGDYINTDTITVFKHLKCGYVFNARPTSIINYHSGCPQCNQSHGEEMIRRILDMYHIQYEPQKTFADLMDKKRLSYDFYLPSQKVLIEYQGYQHYGPVDYYGGEAKFKNQQKHDQMKRNYANQHGYQLVTVSYQYNTLGKVINYLSGQIDLASGVSLGDVEFKEVPTKEIYDLMLNSHYLHRKVNAKYAYGLYLNNELEGMITYTPVRPSLANSISDNATINNTLELSRLYIKDEVSQTTPNITSQFVSWTLKQLKKQGNWFVISFADSGMNHVGSIYQACNFLYLGKTNQDWDIYSGKGRYSEHWVKGKDYRYRVLKTVKYRYLFLVGGKLFKKQARASLKRKVRPYPKADTKHYQPGETEPIIIKDMKTGKIRKED